MDGTSEGRRATHGKAGLTEQAQSYVEEEAARWMDGWVVEVEWWMGEAQGWTMLC